MYLVYLLDTLVRIWHQTWIFMSPCAALLTSALLMKFLISFLFNCCVIWWIPMYFILQLKLSLFVKTFYIKEPQSPIIPVVWCDMILLDSIAHRHKRLNTWETLFATTAWFLELNTYQQASSGPDKNSLKLPW